MLKAVKLPEYKHLLDQAIEEEKKDPSPETPGRPYAGGQCTLGTMHMQNGIVTLIRVHCDIAQL